MSSLLPRDVPFATARLATPTAATVLAAAVAAMLAGCSGEDREFLEAVEASEAGLTRLRIVAPVDYADVDLALAPGESIDFDVVASGEGGVDVDISDVDRDWSVSDPAAGTIDRNGRFTAIATGTASVRLSIGGVRASSLPVSVSTLPINGISDLRGPEAPDPCVAARYVAVGTFDDDTTRLLTDATWSLPGGPVQGIDAPVLRTADDDGADGAVEIVPRAAGPLELRAAARGRTLDETLQVPDSLVGLAIDQATGSSLALRVNSSQNLTVTATFRDADGTERTADVTDNVDFGIDEAGREFGSVSNLDGSRGAFEALAQGTATVRASCGTVASEALTVSVSGGGTTDTGATAVDLAFRVGNQDIDTDVVFQLSLLGGGTPTQPSGNEVELFVSTGSEYDEDDDVTQATVFDSGNENVLLIVDRSDGVFLSPQTVGIARVVATRGNTTAAFTVQVVN